VIQNEFAAPPCSVSIPPALAQGIGAAVSRIARTQLLISRPSDAATVSAGFADWLLALRSEHLGRLGRGIETLEVPSPDVGSRPPSGLADDRSLLLAAVTKLSMSGGYAGLTIPAIRQAAGVSRRSFDDNFGGVDDCFLAAVENRVDGAIERAAKEAATAPNWERATVRMISSLCCQVARDPVLARLALVEILAPGRPGLELRENVVSRCAALLRETAPPSGRPTELGAEASVAAIVSAAAAEAVAGRRQRIGATAPSMAFMGLAPAIGPAAAERAILAELSAVWTHSGQKTSSSCP
jgi:AcrR family transcriptional regulator